MSTSSTTKIRIREAEPADINAVTEIMLAAMPEDRDWWDYRFPYRDQYPDDHKRFLRLLVETWVSAEFADWIVLVAEALDDDDEDGEASGAWQMGAYAVWDAAYVGYRKHGPGYSPPSGMLTTAAPPLPPSFLLTTPSLVIHSARLTLLPPTPR